MKKYSIQADDLRNYTDPPDISPNFTVDMGIKMYNFAKHEELELKNSLTKWMAMLYNMEENSINATAVIAKIHRCLNILKGKWGDAKHSYLSSIFNIPTCTSATCSQTSTSESEEKFIKTEVEKVQIKLSDKSYTIRQLQHDNKNLKRKYDRLINKQSQFSLKKETEVTERIGKALKLDGEKK